jgi:hypothetical protein
MKTALGLVVAVITVTGCGSETVDVAPGSATVPDACSDRGGPVSLGRLVGSFGANGVSLSPTEHACDPTRMGANDADNLSRAGERIPAVYAREGTVLCDIDDGRGGTAVKVDRYEGDTQTYVTFANVTCSVYPSSEEERAAQVARVRAAMDAVAEDRSTR